MSGENYINTASVATTAAPVGPSDLTVTVANYTGYPAAPYWAEIEKGTGSAEIVRVTNVAGLTLTVTRGQGGTSATSHGAGVNVEHVVPASHFNEGETHNAATNAHGVTGNVVGTSGSQSLQDKTYRGAHRSLFSDSLPAGVTASYESVADNASARDGFVHKNTAGDAARSGFLLQQSGTDRFKVTNTGNVTITPSSGTALTANGPAAVTGNTTVGGTLGVTGLSTLSGGANVTGAVTATGTVSGGSLTTSGSVTGLSASILGPIHAGGALDTDSTLVVDGTSTLTGAVTTGAGLVVGTTAAVAQNITMWASPVVSAPLTPTDITSPTTGQVAFDRTLRVWVRWTGSAWFPVTPRAMLRQTDTVDRGSGGWFAIPLNTEDKDTAGGHSFSANISRYTAITAGSYEFAGGGAWAANGSGSRGLRWSKNGTALPQADVVLPATPSGGHSMAAKTYQVDLAVNDYVELECWQNTGSTVTTSGGYMAVKYLGGD